MNKYVFADQEGWIFSIEAKNETEACKKALEDGYRGITCIRVEKA